jgi:hypothetical protein
MGRIIKNSKGESEFQNNVEDINVEVYLLKKMENVKQKQNMREMNKKKSQFEN